MKKLYTIGLVAFLILSCGEDDKPCTDCPTITSIDPAYGVVYPDELTYYYFQEFITIEGTNFGATPEENEVTFNGSPAQINEASSTVLEVQPPYGASSGPVVVSVNGKKSSKKVIYTFIEDVDCDVFNNLEISNVVIDGNSFSFNLSNDEEKPVSLYGTTFQYWTSADDQLGGGNDEAIGGVSGYFCEMVLGPNEECTYEWTTSLSDNYLIIELYDNDRDCNSVISVTEIE